MIGQTEVEIVDDVLASYTSELQKLPPTESSLARAAMLGVRISNVAYASALDTRDVVRAAVNRGLFGEAWLQNQNYGVFVEAVRLSDSDKGEY